jgi:hypothetical protein
MRSLRRPMFRYGGNVKAQGVMHGMKNMQDGGPATMADATGYANGGMSNNQGPRRAALVGNPVYPVGPDGRTGHVAPILVGAGMGIARLAPLAMRAGRGIKNFYKGFTSKPGASPSMGFNKETLRNIFPTGRYRQPATPKGYDAGFRKGQAPAPLTFKEIISNPTTLGRAARENPFTAAGALTLPNMAINAAPGVFGAAKGAGKMFIDAVLPGEQFKEKPPIVEPKKTGTGDRGSLLKTDSAPKALSKEEVQAKDDARLAKIYKLLGVDRSQRNAASKALVDVSRYIDEGGKDTVSKKNIGSTISKAISSFDKRLDKSDQLKEAAGVMMAKSYLEGGDKALDRKYKETMIDAKLKEMNPEFSTVKASYSKTMSGDDLIAATAGTVFKDAFGGTLMNTKKFNKAMKEAEGTATEMDAILQIATNELNQIEARDGEGTIPAGYYAVGDKVVRINSKGVADKVVG